MGQQTFTHGSHTEFEWDYELSWVCVGCLSIQPKLMTCICLPQELPIGIITGRVCHQTPGNEYLAEVSSYVSSSCK